MKFKLDENIDPRAKEILAQAGHNVITVQDEGLGGAADDIVAKSAHDEKRCLVTLDLGFASVLAYPPRQYSGIIVLRHPKPTTGRLLDLIKQLVQALQTEDPKRKLWIVEPGRLRIHESEVFHDN